MARDKKTGAPEPQQEEMTVVVLKFRAEATPRKKGLTPPARPQSLGSGSQNNHRAVVQRQPPQIAAGNGDVIDAEHKDTPMTGRHN